MRNLPTLISWKNRRLVRRKEGKASRFKKVGKDKFTGAKQGKG